MITRALRWKANSTRSFGVAALRSIASDASQPQIPHLIQEKKLQSNHAGASHIRLSKPTVAWLITENSVPSDGIQGTSRIHIASHPATVATQILIVLIRHHSFPRATQSNQAFPRRAAEKVPLENWFVGYFLDAWLNG